jgi:hypothetical protein
MGKQGKLDQDVLIAYVTAVVLGAIALVVALNGGHPAVPVVLLLGAVACGAYVVRRAIKRIR